MPILEFQLKSGEVRTVEAKAGMTVMEVATQNLIRGIIGECGGSCSCATCHVYVERDGGIELPPLSLLEDEMLEGVTAERMPTSRLSCQLVVRDDWSGLLLRIPERQL